MEKGKGNIEGDLYGVMGLDNECTQAELRHAYKNLALKWHPDRFSKPGEREEAKKKFQSVQRAYSVLSDANKRLLYDVGAYDSDDDEIGMGDFLNEMVAMMDQNKSTGEESLEELQELFEELFEDDVESYGSCNGNSKTSKYVENGTNNNNKNDNNNNNSRRIPGEVDRPRGYKKAKGASRIRNTSIST